MGRFVACIATLIQRGCSGGPTTATISILYGTGQLRIGSMLLLRDLFAPFRSLLSNQDPFHCFHLMKMLHDEHPEFFRGERSQRRFTTEDSYCCRPVSLFLTLHFTPPAIPDPTLRSEDGREQGLPPERASKCRRNTVELTHLSLVRAVSLDRSVFSWISQAH